MKDSGGQQQTEGESPVVEMEEVALGSLADINSIVAEKINWRVRVGDYWVIAGLQGSGKSDFLMMTAGLMGPAAGSYRLFGEPMPIFEEARLATRLRLGLAFDGGQLFNHLTVWENVALPLRYHQDLTKAEANEAVKKLLEATELEPWADSTPGAIGRHWQKRVGLARALSLEPEILLVDSPLSGLDLRHASWWLQFLEDLSQGRVLGRKRPMTLVVSSPDLRQWQGHAHQFAIIRNKKFAVLGSWQQLEAASEELLKELLPARSR